MGADKVEIEVFLGELVEMLDARLKEHDEKMEELQRQLAVLRRELKSHSGLHIDKSVLNVLKGK